MEKKENRRHRFGLVGRDIAYSFSRGYFMQKFADMRLEGYTYENFDLEKIEELGPLLATATNLAGLNVTIPYKEAVLPYLSALDPKAAKIGAVNTIQFSKAGLIGHNTDIHGFKASLLPHLQPYHKSALILGTGGASKAVAFVFEELGIPYQFVSRREKEGQLNYSQLGEIMIKDHRIIVNCTPLGTYPNIEDKPAIPYQQLTKQHLLFDLIYNPEKTAFLKAGEVQGCRIVNGLRMLQLQAEKAWEIWNTS